MKCTFACHTSNEHSDSIASHRAGDGDGGGSAWVPGAGPLAVGDLCFGYSHRVTVIQRWERQELVYNKAALRCPCCTQQGSIARSFTGEISFRKKNLSFPGVFFHPRHDMLFSETGRAFILQSTKTSSGVKHTKRLSLLLSISNSESGGRAKARAGGRGRVAPILHVEEAGEKGMTCTCGGGCRCVPGVAVWRGSASPRNAALLGRCRPASQCRGGRGSWSWLQNRP